MDAEPETERHILAKAEKLFRERNYAEIVRQLAPQIFLFRSSSRYYYLMGISSLYINDFGGAHSYLLRGKDIDPLNLDIQLGLAISHLGRKEDTEALRIWVGVQDRHPKNQKAIKGLETLKGATEKIDWVDQLRLGRLRNLYPEPGTDWNDIVKKGSFVAAGLGLIAGVIFLILQVMAIIERRTPPPRDHVVTNVGTASLPANGTPDLLAPSMEDFGVWPGSQPRFQLSSQEIEASISQIRDAFRDYRDNPARILVNKIMQSNAEDSVKEQLRGLSSHFKEPGFTNFRDNVEFAEVVKDPLLYQGVFVKWRGKISDLQKGETKISGNLLLGYEKSRVVSGKVPFEITFPVNIDNDQPVEMIGQIKVSKSTLPQFVLRITAIRLIAEGE